MEAVFLTHFYHTRFAKAFSDTSISAEKWQASERDYFVSAHRLVTFQTDSRK